MNAKGLIRKTRDGEPLTREEIRFLVHGAVTGQLEPYQLTAWMMAVFFHGLSPERTADLTVAMLESGDRLEWENPPYPPADKHSTGGVGDKVSFLVAPLVAAAGVPVPMISGRSLGHTGGTLDKLESIPGIRTLLTPEQISRQVASIGLCIAGQSERLAPADRIFYALRDAASIVESVPLITASILSKKASVGVRALALDVKVGDGAFMPDPGKARSLARSLVDTAARLGIRARAHLTSMDLLLGRTAGNAIEIEESVRALRGEDVAEDLRGLTLALGASMCRLAGRVETQAEGSDLLRRLWDSGEGYERFTGMVGAQGGDPRSLERAGGLPRATRHLRVSAARDGCFVGIRARPAGEWIAEAGGGRLKAADPVDPRVGIEVLRRPGESVRAGDPVLELHLADHEGGTDALRDRAAGWIVLGPLEGREPGEPILLDTIDASSLSGEFEADPVPPAPRGSNSLLSG